MHPPIAASDDSAQSSAKRVNNPANKALTNQTWTRPSPDYTASRTASWNSGR